VQIKLSKDARDGEQENQYVESDPPHSDDGFNDTESMIRRFNNFHKNHVKNYFQKTC